MLPFLVTLALAAPVAPLKIGPIALEELVRSADVVVVGRVRRIADVPRPASARAPRAPGAERDLLDGAIAAAQRLPIAEIEVERVLEGPADLRRAHFLVLQAWGCDVTGAEVGERGLYALTEIDADGALAGFAAPLAPVLDGERLHAVTHWGRGRMRRTADEIEARVECWTGGVTLPPELAAASRRAGSDPTVQSVALDALEARVRRFARQQLPQFRVRAPARGERAAWTLSIWGDGVLAADVEGDPRGARTLPARPEVVPALVEAFTRERFADLPPEVGRAGTDAGAFVLEQRTEARRASVTIAGLDLGAAERPSPELARALRLYAALRDLLPDERASDDRPRIRELLERLR
jgi:hypothetical protein